MKQLVLNAFDKAVDGDGMLVERRNPEQKVLAQNGEEVSIEEFAGIRKGSQVYIKSDIASLMQLCDDLSHMAR